MRADNIEDNDLEETFLKQILAINVPSSRPLVPIIDDSWSSSDADDEPLMFRPMNLQEEVKHVQEIIIDLEDTIHEVGKEVNETKTSVEACVAYCDEIKLTLETILSNQEKMLRLLERMAI